jgi:hypothetical protein
MDKLIPEKAQGKDGRPVYYPSYRLEIQKISILITGTTEYFNKIQKDSNSK